jgi:uncharacterized membrane protein YheB (UPF0754 family)
MIIYFLPFVSAFIGYLASLLTVAMLFKSYKSNTVADKLIDALMHELKKIDLEADLDELLEKHLIEFIGTLKQQIPMASMFLSGTLSDKLKNLAKQEFIKMLPELKDKIWMRFSSNLTFIEVMIRESVSKRMRWISLTAAGIGFLIGCLQALAFLYV